MKLALSFMFVGANGQDLFLAARPSASVVDLRRAHTRTQSGRLGGCNPEEIARNINHHLRRSGVQTKACDTFSGMELNDMVRSMWPYFSSELEDVYKGANDLRSKRYSTISDFEDSWAAENDHDVTALRHAKCHEVVMLWAHHLSETAKKFWKAKLLPALPAYNVKKLETRSMQQQLHAKRDIRWLLEVEVVPMSGQIGPKSCTILLERMGVPVLVGWRIRLC